MTEIKIDGKLALAFDRAKEIIDRSEKILLATHKDPDADGIGSMLALHHFLKSPEKQTILFAPDPVPANYVFLSDAHKISADPPPRDVQIDAIIGLDYGSPERLGIDYLLNDDVPLITFDHHLADRQAGEVLIVDENLSSTAELVYLFLKHHNFSISQDIASAILAGIFADTGGFRHANTTGRVLRAAGDLIERGASLGKISRALWGQKENGVYRLWGRALRKLNTDNETKMVYSLISAGDFEEFSASTDDTEGLPNIINKTSEASFSLFLTERKNGKLKGSLRSERYKKIDNVAGIAGVFGGGGHKLASGFETDESTQNLDKIIEKIRRSLPR